jgi:AcrR family transcriptional regulator
VRVVIADEVGGDVRPRRPKDRRESILLAASTLFHRSGYAGASLDDIAGEVGITAPALYRHFRNKDELYVAALELNLRQLEAAVADATDAADAARRLSAVGVEFPTLGMLWNSDRRRRLADPDGSLDGRVLAANAALAALLERSTGATLSAPLARNVLAAVSSTGYYQSMVSPERARAELERILSTIIGFRPTEDFVTVRVGAEEGSGRPWETRRSALLQAGASLLPRQGGYHAVTIEQIAAEVGVTPATAYAEFPSKAALLAAVFQRAANWFTSMVQQAAAGASSADDALDRAVRAYLLLITEHPSWIGPTLDELLHLPAEYLEPALATTEAYLDEWLTICTAVAPHVDREVVRVRMRAALGVLDDRVVAASTERVLAVDDAATLVGRIIRGS